MSHRNYDGPPALDAAFEFIGSMLRGMFLWPVLILPSLMLIAVPVAFAEGSRPVALVAAGFVVFVIDPAVAMALAFNHQCPCTTSGSSNGRGRPIDPDPVPGGPEPMKALGEGPRIGLLTILEKAMNQ